MSGKKNFETNYAAYANKKIFFPNKQYDNSKSTRGLRGTKLLQKIGTSPAELYKSLESSKDKHGPVYLPPFKDCSVDFLRNLIIGVQPFFFDEGKSKAVIENLNELKVEKLYEEICCYRDVLQYFPARYVKDSSLGYKRLRIPHREFAYTIFKMVKPTEFHDFIKRCKAENRGRIKTRENQHYEILEEFASKAEEYDVFNYDKCTMHASIMNKSRRVNEKRKRDMDRMNGIDVESSNDEENKSASEEETDEVFEGDGGMPDADVKMKVDRDIKEKSKIIKGLEVRLRMSAWDQTKDIDDEDDRVKEYNKIADYLESYYKDFDLKMPTYEEAIQIYE